MSPNIGRWSLLILREILDGDVECVNLQASIYTNSCAAVVTRCTSQRVKGAERQ
ncbi:MAG: hypothetical protein M3R24_22710 [Chloroflexota bacterium]|nr:hypothetical protein [Chloroflexota bacterium]